MEENSLSIVIPVYNEAEKIEEVLIELKDFLDKNVKNPYEIICVNDCSKDDSLKILQSIDFIKVVDHKINRGYGAALKSGIYTARNKVILIMDSDGQHKVEDIPQLVNSLPGYSMVVGTRAITNTKKNRVLGKVVIHKLANYLLREEIPDINSGFRCFYREEVKKYLYLFSERFSFTTSLTTAYIQEHKYIKNIPIEVRNRTTGESGVNYKAGLRAILKIIQMVMVFNPLRVLLPIAFFFIGLTFASLIFNLINENLTDTTVLLGITTILIFIFSLVSDQISSIRKAIWAK